MSNTSFSYLPKGVIVKQWNIFADNIGELFPIPFKELPFIPKRIFFVSDVPAGAIRGGHAHYKTQQYIICIKGIIRVLLFDGTEKKEFVLKEGHGTLIDKLIWDSQQFMTGSDVLLVLASTEFNEVDYIKTEKQFLKYIKNGK